MKVQVWWMLLYFTRGSFSYHLLPEMHSQLVRSSIHSQRIHVSRCIAWCGLVWLSVAECGLVWLSEADQQKAETARHESDAT